MRSRRRAASSPPSRSCAATSSAFLPVRRSAGCSPRSRRSGRRVRSPRRRRRSTMHDATRERFARTAERVAELQDARAAELEQQVVRFVAPTGDERVLDSGTGAGALAFALAPHVREVVAVDLVPELLEQGRKRGAGFPNVTFVEGDATKLPFELGSFDLTASLRTLHHIARPELAVAELVRVTRQRGRVLVVDQIAPVDPLAALALK